MVKRLSTMRETRVRSLGWEDPLEKAMATHSSTLAWKIPWTEKPGGLQTMGSQRVGHDGSSLTHVRVSMKPAYEVVRKAQGPVALFTGGRFCGSGWKSSGRHLRVF